MDRYRVIEKFAKQNNWTPVAKSVREAFGDGHKVTGKDVWYAVKD